MQDPHFSFAIETMNRTDPFFQSKPHQNSFLEAMYRTYPSALPQRDDSTYKRALAFRDREKAHYSSLGLENEQLRAHNRELEMDVARIKELWDKLSKQTTVTNVKSGNTHASDGVVHQRSKRDTGRANAPVPDGANGGGSGGRTVRLSGDEEDVGGAQGGSVEGVQSSVLPTERGADSRGQEAEHGPVGPEHGGGVGSVEEGGDAGDGVAAGEQ